MNKTRIGKTLLFVLVSLSTLQYCSPKIDKSFIDSTNIEGAYKFHADDCSGGYNNYIGHKYKTLFERDKSKPIETVTTQGGCYLTHLREVTVNAPKLCELSGYYAVVNVYSRGFGWIKPEGVKAGPNRESFYQHVFSKSFEFGNVQECQKGMPIKLGKGLNTLQIRLAKKPLVPSNVDPNPIDAVKFDGDRKNWHDEFAYIIMDEKEIVQKIASSYNVRETQQSAEEKAATTTEDSAYRVFVNTAHHPNQILTNDQLSQNEKHYTGKAFTNWTLKLADVSGGCVDFDEPQTGYNWGKFCGAQDVAAFKAKYPNHRKGTMFTIKSGKITRWVLGPHLTELTF